MEKEEKKVLKKRLLDRTRHKLTLFFPSSSTLLVYSYLTIYNVNIL